MHIPPFKKFAYVQMLLICPLTEKSHGSIFRTITEKGPNFIGSACKYDSFKTLMSSKVLLGQIGRQFLLVELSFFIYYTLTREV